MDDKTQHAIAIGLACDLAKGAAENEKDGNPSLRTTLNGNMATRHTSVSCGDVLYALNARLRGIMGAAMPTTSAGHGIQTRTGGKAHFQPDDGSKAAEWDTIMGGGKHGS